MDLANEVLGFNLAAVCGVRAGDSSSCLRTCDAWWFRVGRWKGVLVFYR